MRDTNNKFISYVNPNLGLETLVDYVIEKNSNQNCRFFGIFHKQSYEHLGNVKLEPLYPGGFAFLGIFIGNPLMRNRGIGSEVIRKVTNYGFEQFQLQSIFLGVHPKNYSAIHVYKKLGFVIDKKIVATDKYIQMVLNAE